MKKEKKEVRVIKVFDNEEDVYNEFLSNQGNLDLYWSLGETVFLMNVAIRTSDFILQYEAGLISKNDLDSSLLKKDCISNVNSLGFNFLFVSSINNHAYISMPYCIDGKDLYDTFSKILELYSELSIMYSFDSIIDKIQKMVADFKAAHEDFDKMTNEERLKRFWSWPGNKDYMKKDLFEKHLDKCRTIYDSKS